MLKPTHKGVTSQQASSSVTVRPFPPHLLGTFTSQRAQSVFAILVQLLGGVGVGGVGAGAGIGGLGDGDDDGDGCTGCRRQHGPAKICR